MRRGFVKAQVGGREFDLQKIGAPGEVQGTRLRGEGFALDEDVFDVLAGEGLACDGVLDGPGHFVRSIDVGQSDDFVDLSAGIERAGGELPVVVFGVGTQGVKAQEPLGIPGAAALVQEFFDVLGVFKIAVTIVAAGMGGHQIVGMVEAEPLGEDFKRQALGGVERGHRISVGVQGDPAAVGHAHQTGRRGVAALVGKRTKSGLFHFKE